jgi:DNA repair photolyase
MSEPLYTRKKVKITSGTREWADYNINCAIGCYNNCRYCYAKIIAKRFGRATDRTWRTMKIRRAVVTKTYKKFRGRVMFPSTHDIVNLPKIEEACFVVLGKLLERENDVLITTKPRFNIIKKIDDLYSMHKDHIQFRFTITSIDNHLLRFWEPNAPLFQERMDALRYAFYRKYKTSVSVEPFLDYDPEPLVRRVEPYSTESIWIGIMNYIPRQNIPKDNIAFYQRIRRNYEVEHLREIYQKLKRFHKIRFKDSFRIKLGIESLH